MSNDTGLSLNNWPIMAVVDENAFHAERYTFCSFELSKIFFWLQAWFGIIIYIILYYNIINFIILAEAKQFMSLDVPQM